MLKEEFNRSHPVMQLLSAAGYFAIARFDDPAAVLAFVPPGAGNLWISVTMMNKGAAQ